MDNPNAFSGKREKPTGEEVSAALGASAKIWEQLVDELVKEYALTQEWTSFSPKYGWSLQLKLKKRTILHLSPCQGYFRAALALGDRAMKAARENKFSKTVAKVLEDAPRYAEGTGVRIVVKKAGDLAAIRKLVVVKLEN